MEKRPCRSPDLTGEEGEHIQRGFREQGRSLISSLTALDAVTSARSKEEKNLPEWQEIWETVHWPSEPGLSEVRPSMPPPAHTHNQKHPSQVTVHTAHPSNHTGAAF